MKKKLLLGLSSILLVSSLSLAMDTQAPPSPSPVQQSSDDHVLQQLRWGKLMPEITAELENTKLLAAYSSAKTNGKVHVLRKLSATKKLTSGTQDTLDKLLGGERDIFERPESTGKKMKIKKDDPAADPKALMKELHAGLKLRKTVLVDEWGNLKKAEEEREKAGEEFAKAQEDVKKADKPVARATADADLDRILVEMLEADKRVLAAKKEVEQRTVEAEVTVRVAEKQLEELPPRTAAVVEKKAAVVEKKVDDLKAVIKSVKAKTPAPAKIRADEERLKKFRTLEAERIALYPQYARYMKKGRAILKKSPKALKLLDYYENLVKQIRALK